MFYLNICSFERSFDGCRVELPILLFTVEQDDYFRPSLSLFPLYLPLPPYISHFLLFVTTKCFVVFWSANNSHAPTPYRTCKWNCENWLYDLSSASAELTLPSLGEPITRLGAWSVDVYRTVTGPYAVKGRLIEFFYIYKCLLTVKVGL